MMEIDVEKIVDKILLLTIQKAMEYFYQIFRFLERINFMLLRPAFYFHPLCSAIPTIAIT